MRNVLAKPSSSKTMARCRQHRTRPGGACGSDGYTLSLGHWGTHVVNGAVYSLSLIR